MGEQILLTSLYTLVAVIEAVLATYIYVADTKSRINRAVTALLVLFSVNNISVIGMFTTFTLESAQFYHWLLIATTYSIGPAIFLTSIIVLRPKLSDNRRIYSFLLFTSVIPLVVATLDVIGISQALLGQSLLYQALDPASYSGGFVEASNIATGSLRLIFLFNLIGFPIIGMIYPALIVAIRDRKTSISNSRFAWVLFGAILAATLLAGARNQISPPVAILLQNIAFTIGFTYVGLLSGGDELSIQRLPEAIADWRMINKLRLVIGTIIIPVVIIVGVIAAAFLQSNIVNIVGKDLATLADAEARNVSNEINRQVDRLLALSKDPLLATLVTSRESVYANMSDPEIRKLLIEIESTWQETPNNSGLVESLLSGEKSSTLRNFNLISPSHTQLIATDRVGALLTATERTDLYDHSDAEWWQAAYSGGNGAIFVGFPVFDEEIGQFILEIAVPIRNSDLGAEVDGILLSRYSLEDINSDIELVVVGEAGGLALFNQQGEWLPTEAAMTQQDPMLNWELLLNNDQNWHITPFGGIDSVIGWADTSDADMTNYLDLRVVTFIPSDEALASVTAARNTSFVALLVILAGTAGITTVLAGFITVPLTKLTQAAEKILSGDTGVVFEITGKDEIGTLASTFNNMTLQLTNLVTGLEHAIIDRTNDLERRAIQMETAAEVAREAAAIRDSKQLLDRVTNLISDRFGFYHTGIFLLDESGEYAVLHSANSEGGQRMLARGHKLQVGKVGVVGYSAGQGEPRIAQDVGADVIYYDNPDMPDTRSEMALPLMIHNQVIGVLDVQATESNAFSKEDVQILQTLADQIALAIENTRLFQSSQKAVEELEYLYGREIGQAWRKRIEKEATSFTYTASGADADSDGISQDSSPDAQRISKPIMFRGQMIGTLELERDSNDSPWADEEIALIDEIIEQTALALENARLSEQIRLRSDQIQLLQEITSMAASTLDEKKILDAATQRLLSGFELLNCSIVLVEPDQKSGILSANAILSPSKNNSKKTIGSTVNLDNEVSLEVIRTKKTSIIYDLQNNKKVATAMKGIISPEANAFAMVPMIIRDEVIGTINLAIADKDRLLDAEDINLLEQISARIAAAIDIVHLFEGEQEARQDAARRAEREHLVSEITSRVRATNNPQDIINIAVEELRQALAPDTGKLQINSIPTDAVDPKEENGQQENMEKEETTKS